MFTNQCSTTVSTYQMYLHAIRMGGPFEQGGVSQPGDWLRYDEKRGGLMGSTQHWPAVYPPEFEIPRFVAAGY